MARRTEKTDTKQAPLSLETAMNLISTMERASMVMLSLRELLHQAGQEDLARLANVAFLDTSTAAETLGDALGVEVDCG